MIKTTPSISVVIPTFKRPDLLRRLLVSIRIQTFKNFEVIVADDCSPNQDEYAVLCEEARDWFPAFTYIRLEENAGAPAARNAGIHKANAPWIALVDDDDEWFPNKLALQHALIDTSQDDLGLIYGSARMVGPQREELYHYRAHIRGHCLRKILTTNFICSPTVLVKTQAIKDAGLFDVQMPSCQDWDMWASIADAGYAFDYVEDDVAYYHHHGGMSIGSGEKAQLGYRLFISKWFWKMLTRTTPINSLQKSFTLLARR